MSCQRSPPTVVCSRRWEPAGGGKLGRGCQHSCHSLVKTMRCWWAAAAARLLTLARRHQLSDYIHRRNGNGLIKNFDFNHQGALTSRSWSRSDRGVTVTIIDHSNNPTSTALLGRCDWLRIVKRLAAKVSKFTKLTSNCSNWLSNTYNYDCYYYYGGWGLRAHIT